MSVGILLGGVLAVIVVRLLTGLLYGVIPVDPVTFALAPVLLLVVGMLACYLLARRAMRVDPLVALRSH